MLQIWFCRECKRKGELAQGIEGFALFSALSEHSICSPDCEGSIRTASEKEAEKDPEIRDFKNWLDD
jgi:hypothetical protein